MQEQMALIKKYREHFKKPTYREMAKDLGIQSTRLFRIFQGQEMKLSEFLKFQNRVRLLEGDEESLTKLASKASLVVSPSGKKEIEIFINRTIKAALIKRA